MPSQPLELVRRAFLQARESGKQDWARMALPVLKNRLLAISDRTFKESDYGASRFRDFVRGLVGDRLALDESVEPPVAVWLDAPEPASQEASIRPDLWKAVLDYSTNRIYVWDPQTNQARVGIPEERHVVPTVTAHEFDTWRRDFVISVEAKLSPAERERVDMWQKRRLPTINLPAPLRGPWNADLKRRVRERITQFFVREGLQMPPEVFGLETHHRDVQARNEADDLRQFVLDCVMKMTFRELRMLNLPAAALWRTRGGTPDAD